MPSPKTRRGQTSVAERYRALLDTGRTLTGTLSYQDLFAVIHRETATVLEASGFYISLYDQSRDLATVVYYADKVAAKHVDISYRGSDSEVIKTLTASLVNENLGDKSLLILGDEDSDVTRFGDLCADGPQGPGHGSPQRTELTNRTPIRRRISRCSRASLTCPPSLSTTHSSLPSSSSDDGKPSRSRKSAER